MHYVSTHPVLVRWPPLGCTILPFFLQIFFASILSGDHIPKEYRNIKICSKNTFLRFPQTTFHFTKEISKYTKENIQAERFGSHFLHIGLINLIS